MERNREGRRGAGGGGSMNGHNNKRRRLEPQHNHHYSYEQEGTSNEEEEEEEEVDTAMAAIKGAEAGGSSEEEDDDDDLPPPVVVHHHHRHSSGKLKKHTSHVKGEDEEEEAAAIAAVAPVDLAVPVPRKLRTAVKKRYQESPPRHNVNESDGGSNSKKKQKQQQPSNGRIRLPPPNSKQAPFEDASLKSAAPRTKPSNHSKPRAAKLAKISPSKQEVEVAETLYDLARMFVNQARPNEPIHEVTVDPKLEWKPEVKLEPASAPSLLPASDATSAQSIQHAPSSGLGPSVAAASSPSSTQTPVHSGAPKKKRPHSSKVKVGGKPVASTATSPCISATSLGVATELVDAKQVQQQTQSARIPSAGPIVVPEVALATGSPGSTAVPVSSLPTKQLQTAENNSATSDKKSSRIEVSGHALVDNTSTKESVTAADKSQDVVGSSVAREAMTKVENEERSMPSPPAEGACTTKVEIDLMAPPKVSEKTEENTNFSMEDAKEKEEVGSLTVPEVIENALSNQHKYKYEPEPKAKNTEIYDETKESMAETGHEQCKDWYPQNNNEKVGETGEPTDYLRQREKQDVDKQMPEGAAKKVVEDSMDQAVDGSDLALLPSMITRAESSTTSLPLSISLGVTGWPGGVPSLGYHSLATEASVGASYSSPVSVMATTTVEEKSALTPALPPLPAKMRLSWKRCATHAYIGRFINRQEQVKRNPLWDAAYGNSTHLYGTKSYNSNAPLAHVDAKFGNSSGIELMGTSITNTHGLSTGVNRLAVDSIKETGLSSAAVAAADVQGTVGISSSPYIDAHGKNTSSQQQIQTVQEQTASPLQIGSPLGLAISQSAAVSAIPVATAGDNIRMPSAMAFGGSSVPISSLPIGTGSGPTTGSVPNVASVQAQFLHPVIQHPSFPISFSPGQAAPSTSGHVPTQQAAQYFNNSFYNTQLMQQQSNSQQPQQATSLTSETSDTQKQQYQRFPSVCGFASLGSPQQISWSPFYSTQTLLASAPQQQQQLIGKENTAAEAVSMKSSTTQRNIYSKNLSSVQVPTVNSSSSLLATGMPALPIRPQDLNLMAAFGGKQDGAIQQKTDMHVQSHHHSMSQLQQQQQQNHIVIPSLQMSLKDVDSHTSPSSSANRGPTSTSVLGLPAGASVMSPQGHTSFHGIGSQHQLSFHDQSASGQSHQLFMAASQQQQQLPAQMQRLVSRGLEDGRTNTNEGSCSEGGRLDDMKVPAKHQLYQPYWEAVAPTYIQGSPTSGTFSLTRNCSSPRNPMVPSTDDGSSIAYASISIPAQQPSQSSKKMARTKATSSSIVSSAQAESPVITFVDRHLNVANFPNVPSGQAVPFPGQISDSSNQCRRQGHSQQFAQTKIAGPPSSTASGTSTMLAGMARNQGQLSKNEQSALDTVPTSSRASPAPPVSTFSSSILSPSPASSKSGGATLSKISSAKDSYSHQQKASSVAAPEKKTVHAIVPNMSSILGPSPFSQNLSSMSIPVQMIQNQIQGQKKTHGKQQRKQQQMLQPSPQQSAQSMGSTQQRQQQQQPAAPQHYNFQQFPNQKQAHQLERHPSAQTTPQNQQLGDMQQQHIKHLQDQELQIQQSFLRQQSPQSGHASSQNQQFENMQQKNVTHLQQHQQTFSTPYSIVMNGNLASPLTLGTNAGNSPRSIVSDGTVISQSSILRPSTPANFTATASVPSSTSQGIGASGSVLQNNEYGSTRNSPLNRQ